MHNNLALAVLLSGSTLAAASEPTVTFAVGKGFLPALRQIVVVDENASGPAAPKHKAVAAAQKYGQALKLPNEGPFDVWWAGKEGLPIKFANGLRFKDTQANSLKVDDYVGIVTMRGDNQPRASLITIAPVDDPGPDEKGHRPIQTATDYRVDMPVPEGLYSVWITPDNGARPQRVIDRLRVQAGKWVQAD